MGGPHSLREVGRGDGGGREQWRREKNAHRLWWKQSAAAAGGEVASTAALALLHAVAFIGASTRYAKNTFDIPPPFFLAARFLEINIQMPWSAAPAVYRTVKVL